MSTMQEQYEKKLQCLCSQLQDFHRQNQQIQEELESTRGRLNSSCREQEELKRAINQRDDTIISLESELDKIKFEIKEKEMSFQRHSECLQSKISKMCEQIQHKDSALTVCQNEVKNHVTSMEDVKDKLCCDIKHKDSLLCQLRESLENVYEELKCKSDENSTLSRNMLSLKSKLSQYSSYCGELENKVSCLQEKIPLMECQFSKEKQQAVIEMEQFEKKLCQAQNDTSCAIGEVKKLKRIVAEKEDEMALLCTEKENLCRELSREKEEKGIACERVETLECDNREICRLLQLKIKTLKELEQTLCVREQELENCKNCVEDLNAKIRELNTGGIQSADNSEDVERQLMICQDALQKCENERKELEKKLQYAVREMEKLAKEVKRLKCELDGTRSEICDKDSMIIDLQQTLERAKQDMDARMCRIDQQLEKYEKEIKDKTHMLAETGDKCCRFQEAVAEKNCEIEQLDTKLSRTLYDLDCLRAQFKELDESKQCLQAAFNEERCNNTELCQEGKRIRDQLNGAYKDLSVLKRDLGCCQRDVDKRIKENNELRQQLVDQECQVHRLGEEKNCLSNKISSLQCRFEDETKQMTQKFTDMKNRQEAEVSKLQSFICELEDTNSSLSQKLSTKDRQFTQSEKNHYQKVDCLNRENCLLQGKLQDKESQLQATKDCLTVKDSEIMRLKLRLCSNDRCNSNNPVNTCSDMYGTSNYNCTVGNTAKKRSKSCDGRNPCSSFR